MLGQGGTAGLFGKSREWLQSDTVATLGGDGTGSSRDRNARGENRPG
jgi:hypothetical protein